MVMTPDARIAIGTGIVILIAIATSHRHLRADMSILRGEIRGEIHGLRREMNAGMQGRVGG